MKIELEAHYIQAIANKVVELLIPYLKSIHEPDQIMTIEQVSVMLEKSKGQIYQWVHDASHGLSDFPYQKAGRTLRFSRKDIVTWMKTNGKRLESR